MQTSRLVAFGLVLGAGCASALAPPVLPPMALGDVPAPVLPVRLDGPYPGLDGAPAPLGGTRVPLLTARLRAPMLEAALVEVRAPEAESRCQVALRRGDGWYVGPTFACHARGDGRTTTIEATAIEAVAGPSPGVVLRFVERTEEDDPARAGDARSHERAMRIDCESPDDAPPACRPPRADSPSTR